ncbi:IQ calmodulin-binding motif, partial [Musa troglodytarum]
ALDFASLKHCSVSFFDVGKPETAASRWARARTRAAKIGKGLSKDEKAQKLALQHWLEAVSFLPCITVLVQLASQQEIGKLRSFCCADRSAPSVRPQFAVLL